MNHHDMKLEAVYPSGAEMWVCPSCHYRFVVQWQPTMKRITLEEGEHPAVLHGGSTGQIHLSATVSSDDKYDELFKRKP